MKRILTFFIPLLILGAVAYQFRDVFNFSAKACEEPIPYTLGDFDTKFGISKEYFLSALVEAEAIWESRHGRELFTYVSDGSLGSARDLKVNLVYDYRQQATSKLESLGIVVENNRASYDDLKAKLEALKAEYERDKAEYEARVDAFNQSDRTDAREFKNLQRAQKELNNKVDEINALVVALNRLIATLNLSVEKYNTTNEARGESFEEGVYVEDGESREIDIYEFSSRAKLVRVLAHELGHALGLEHVSDEEAIMYELNQSDSTTLSASDVSALRALCGENNI